MLAGLAAIVLLTYCLKWPGQGFCSWRVVSSHDCTAKLVPMLAELGAGTAVLLQLLQLLDSGFAYPNSVELTLHCCHNARRRCSHPKLEQFVERHTAETHWKDWQRQEQQYMHAATVQVRPAGHETCSDRRRFNHDLTG